MEKTSLIILFLFLGFLHPGIGESIQLDAPPEAWEPVLQELSSKGSLNCQFEELRRNPFHKLPKRFQGRIWWHPEMGLCLYYEQPGQLIVNILQDGVWLGRPDEILKPLPGNEQQEFMLLFSKLFNWDTAWLSENFTADGSQLENGEWKLSLRATEESLSRMLTRINLSGSSGLLQQILLDLRGGRTIEIHLSGQERDRQFDEDEIRHAFPPHHE